MMTKSSLGDVDEDMDDIYPDLNILHFSFSEDCWTIWILAVASERRLKLSLVGVQVVKAE